MLLDAAGDVVFEQPLATLAEARLSGVPGALDPVTAAAAIRARPSRIGAFPGILSGEAASALRRLRARPSTARRSRSRASPSIERRHRRPRALTALPATRSSLISASAARFQQLLLRALGARPRAARVGSPTGERAGVMPQEVADLVHEPETDGRDRPRGAPRGPGTRATDGRPGARRGRAGRLQGRRIGRPRPGRGPGVRSPCREPGARPRHAPPPTRGAARCRGIQADRGSPWPSPPISPAARRTGAICSEPARQLRTGGRAPASVLAASAATSGAWSATRATTCQAALQLRRRPAPQPPPPLRSGQRRHGRCVRAARSRRGRPARPRDRAGPCWRATRGTRFPRRHPPPPTPKGCAPRPRRLAASQAARRRATDSQLRGLGQPRPA